MPEPGEKTDPENNGNGEFTPEQQAKVDAIVRDRLARQAAQLKKDVPDADELQKLRDAAAQMEAIENASKDDLEKANETIESLREQLADRASENERLTTQLRDTTVKQLVITEAAKAQYGDEKDETFVDPEDAFINLDSSKIEYDDEGNATNIADLVESIASSKRHLLGVRQSAGPDLDLGPRETTTDNPELSAAQEHAQFLQKII